MIANHIAYIRGKFCTVGGSTALVLWKPPGGFIPDVITSVWRPGRGRTRCVSEVTSTPYSRYIFSMETCWRVLKNKIIGCNFHQMKNIFFWLGAQRLVTWQDRTKSKYSISPNATRRGRCASNIHAERLNHLNFRFAAKKCDFVALFWNFAM